MNLVAFANFDGWQPAENSVKIITSFTDSGDDRRQSLAS